MSTGASAPCFTGAKLEVSADLGKHNYCIAIPCYEGKLQAETALSLLTASGALTRQGVHHVFNLIRGGALIDAVRNEMVHRFLHETKSDTLICIDADIEFPWESFLRLCVWSDHYPIVQGIYCGREDPPKFICATVENKLNEHGLLPAKGAGFGFVAIQRKVFESIDAPTYGPQNIKQFFKTGNIEDGEYVGEDVYFFRRAYEAGFTCMVDPGITLKHHGSKVYDYQFKDAVHTILGDEDGFQND